MFVRVKRNYAFLASALTLGIAISGCTTAGGNRSVASRTAMDRAIGQCVASVAVGAAVGAIVGGIAAGKRSAGRGALVGGAIGVGRCAILLHVAAAEDRARIRQAELSAIRANASQTRSIRTNSGKSASIRTDISAAPLPAAKPAQATASPEEPTYTACRYSKQTVTVDGQSAAGERQLWCRAETGDWQPIVS